MLVSFGGFTLGFLMLTKPVVQRPFVAALPACLACSMVAGSDSATMLQAKPTIGATPTPQTVVNAWTEWATLREIVVGNADNANFPPKTPSMHPAGNPEGGSSTMLQDGHISESVGEGEHDWPVGRKSQATIDAANWQLDNLARVLEEQGVTVRRPNDYAQVDWSGPLKTPFFDVPNQYCATCPVRATCLPLLTATTAVHSTQSLRTDT